MLQGVVPGYLEASMETFLRNQEKLREHVAHEALGLTLDVGHCLANREGAPDEILRELVAYREAGIQHLVAAVSINSGR